MGLSGKKLLLLGFVVVLMVVIPLTVYLVQQQQKLKVGAQPASSLSFTVSSGSSSTINKSGDTASFDVMLDPSTNQVSFVKLVITYDTAKVSVNTFTPDTTNFPTVLQQADKGASTGKATVTLSVGQDPNKIVTGSPPRRVATISFNALSSATAGTTTINFDRDPTNGTQVLSIGTNDQFSENVLANASPTTVTIAQGAVGGTAPTSSPASSTSSTASCTSLNSDKGTTGNAPFPVTLTAVGSASGASTISKVTFNWGDGPVQDFTTGGGVGTNLVNFSNPHTYNNAGTFTATATFTDNAGNVSAVGACTKTFTLAAATSPSPSSSPSTSTGGGGAGTGTGGTGTTQIVTVATPSPSPTSSPTSLTTSAPGTKGGLPAPGPGDKIVSFGGLGILSAIVGVLLLFGL